MTMLANNILISVVVCTHNRSQLLKMCLESLVSQQIADEQYEIIVVDNCSSDDTDALVQEYVRAHKHVRGLKEENLGLSHARNRGWREALGKIVAYLDDDARATSDWCGRILKSFESVQPLPVAVGGMILPIYEASPPSWFSDEFEIRSRGKVARFLDPISERDGFSGSNMAFRRDILERYGGFSASLGMFGNKLRVGEDTEFFQRISERDGYFWYDPDVTVYHWTPRRNCTFSYRFMRGFRVGEAAIHLTQRHILSEKYARELICLFIVLLSAPYRLLVAKEVVKTEAARLFQEIGVKSGFLFGKGST